MLKFKIVTPAGITYADDTVEQVTIPTTTGEITVLPNHIPLVSILSPGELIIYKKGERVPLAVGGGVVEIRPKNEVYVLADAAERAEEINLELAEAARARAEELLRQQQAMADVDFAKLQAAVERELARVRVGKKYRKINV